MDNSQKKVGISYYTENFPLEGQECPICEKKSWMVFKCNQCGKVFCKHCHSDYVNVDDETGTIEVICECGSTTLFIDFDD